MAPVIDLAALRARAPSPDELVELLDLDRGRRRHHGPDVRVLCPAHNERTPSCSIEDKGGATVWHCHGCGEGGDWIDLVAEVRGHVRRSREALEAAAELVGVGVDRWGRAPARVEQEDPIIELARRIDIHAARWERGLVVRVDEVIEVAPGIELLEAIAVLFLIDLDQERADDEDEGWTRRVENEEERQAYWARRPHYDGPIHLAAEGRPPPAYYAYLRALDEWQKSRRTSGLDEVDEAA